MAHIRANVSHEIFGKQDIPFFLTLHSLAVIFSAEGSLQMPILDSRRRPTKFQVGDSILWDGVLGGFVIKRGRRQLYWPDKSDCWRMMGFENETHVEAWARKFAATHGFGIKEIPARGPLNCHWKFILIAEKGVKARHA